MVNGHNVIEVDGVDEDDERESLPPPRLCRCGRPLPTRPNDHLWWPREKVADMLDISVRQFDSVVRPLLPPHAVHKHGRSVDIYAPSVPQAFLRWQRGQR